MTRSVAGGLVAGLWLMVAGCLSDDLSHCAHRAGNATCAELGFDGFCSICASANNGCVEAEPEDRCYRPGDTTSGNDATGPGTGTTTTDPSAPSSEETAPTLCMSEGVDESCPASDPYCIGGACSECNDGPADLCAGVDAATPACHPGSGQCLECVGNADCDDRVCGDAYACVRCTRHSDCPSSACDLRTNECLSALVDVWVDPSDCDPPGFGTESDPYCTFADAIANIDTDESGVIHLRSSMFITEPIQLAGSNGRTLVVLGEDNPSLNGEPIAVTVGTTSAIFIDGVRILASQQSGATCSAQGELWFTDVEFDGNANAITGTGCKRVVLERSKIIGSEGDAVAMDGGRLDVVSSALVGNGADVDATAAVRATSTELYIRYSTFADNRGSGGNASIACSSSTGEIRNSVIVSTNRPTVDCSGPALANSVVGGEVEGEGVVVVDTYDAGWFVDVATGDVRIAAPDDSPFRDVAVWGDGDPLRDLSGERRLAYPGLVEFAGAVQP